MSKCLFQRCTALATTSLLTNSSMWMVLFPFFLVPLYSMVMGILLPSMDLRNLPGRLRVTPLESLKLAVVWQYGSEYSPFAAIQEWIMIMVLGDRSDRENTCFSKRTSSSSLVDVNRSCRACITLESLEDTRAEGGEHGSTDARAGSVGSSVGERGTGLITFLATGPPLPPCPSWAVAWERFPGVEVEGVEEDITAAEIDSRKIPRLGAENGWAEIIQLLVARAPPFATRHHPIGPSGP